MFTKEEQDGEGDQIDTAYNEGRRTHAAHSLTKKNYKGEGKNTKEHKQKHHQHQNRKYPAETYRQPLHNALLKIVCPQTQVLPYG